MAQQIHSGQEASLSISRLATNKAYSLQADGSTAWLIPYTAQHFIALPVVACQEIIEHPNPIKIPGGAGCAYGLIPWHSEWLALVDLYCLFNDKALPADVDVRRALVVAYRNTKGQTAYGAFSLPYLPTMVTVQEADFCPLPAHNHHWPQLAVSCFRHQGHAVPIIDLSRLFRH